MAYVCINTACFETVYNEGDLCGHCLGGITPERRGKVTLNELRRIKYGGSTADQQNAMLRMKENGQPLAPISAAVVEDVEDFIQRGLSYYNPTKSSKAIFISYASEMHKEAFGVSKFLSKIWHDVWFDGLHLRPDAELDSTIEKEMSERDYIVACISCHCGNAARYVRKEISIAMRKARKSNHVSLIPYILGSSNASELREFFPIYASDPNGLSRLALTIERSGSYFDPV